MTIAAGTRLGPYEILSPLGAGGMGEVYKARDTRLDRTAAIKVLPAGLAGRAELRERMQREARAISSLNHPHICALYDVGLQDGTDYLVMEYLEGPTLAERLRKGPLPLKTALAYAIEIAGALDQAHRQGIVHRDLKPGNVILTKSGTKLLDFGLAKMREAAKAAPEGETALLTRDLTSEGAIVGTFQYMAPEQLEGKDADARSDIFAFGALLYELLTGRRVFAGASQASLIAAILKEEPAPMENLQGLTPARLERVVRTCLAKDPDERWQSAGDLKRELQWIADASGEGQRKQPKAGGERTGWVVAAVAAAIAIGIAWVHWRAPAVEPRTVRFTVATDAGLPAQASISPDGRRLAFVGLNAQGKSVVWVRSLDKATAQPVEGTEGAKYPFWSPDSRQIAFFDSIRHNLKTIDASGGRPRSLVDTGFALGGDWGPEGILYAPGNNGAGKGSGLYRIAASGGVPARVTVAASGSSHSFPHFLPDGKHFLYLDRPFYFSSTQGASMVRVGSLESKESRPLVASPYNAVFSPGAASRGGNGPHLLFVRDGALMAQEIDVNKWELRGEPVRIVEVVATDAAYGFGDFSVSKDGTLAFNAAVHQHEVIWLDRGGNRIGAAIPADRYAHPALSPDGSLAVFEREDPRAGEVNLWKLDVNRGDLSLFERGGTLARFSPDGSAVGWVCRIDGKPQFCRKAAGGAARPEAFWDGGGDKVLLDFSRDGRFASFSSTAERIELWILPLEGERRPFRFYPSEFSQFHGEFAPDGKWIAYTTNETGDYEVYVQPFPATGEKWKVSVNGGAQPAWRRDGTELFYRTGDGKMMAAPVKTAPKFAAGAPRMLFQLSADPLFPNLGVPYAVSADGQRFLVNVAMDESRTPPITVVTNWTAGMEP